MEYLITMPQTQMEVLSKEIFIMPIMISNDKFMKADIVISGDFVIKNRFGNDGIIIDNTTIGYKIAKFLKLI